MTPQSDPVANGASPAPRGLVPLIALLSMIGPFTIDTYLPSFPDIARDFGVGLPAMAQTLSVYLLAFAAATLMWGPVTDAFGRRRTVVVSMSLYVLTSLGCALSDSLAHMLLSRLLQGIAASGGLVIARAVIRDVYDGPHARRAMSQVMMMFALAPAAAPVIGGWLHEWSGWRSVFWFLGLYGVSTLALVMWLLPETHPPTLRQSLHHRSVLRNYRDALTNRHFVGLVLTLCFSFGGMFLYIVGSPAIIFDHLGLGASSFGVQFIPMVAGVMTGSWVAGRLALHAPPGRIINAGLLLAGLAVVLNLAQAFWLAPRIVTVIGPIVVYAFAVALLTPNLTVMALDCFPRNRGLASAVQAFVQMALNALVAALVMPLVAPSLPAFALAQGAFLLLAALLWRLR